MPYNLPPPPLLKTTIIQLNKELDSESSNYEILTTYGDNNGSSSSGGSSGEQASNPSTPPVVEQQKRKRRRSTANIDEEELAKRKSETKQMHSIIEKRRRIKINREFEALKYLIPACRSTGASSASGSGSSGTSGGKPKLSAANTNNNKIDGMYKLTILKSSVEYILYLHHLLQQQNKIIGQFDPHHNFDILWAQIPLDVNQYRNIDKDFNFNELAEEFEQQIQQAQALLLLVLLVLLLSSTLVPLMQQPSQPFVPGLMPQYAPISSQPNSYRLLPLNQIQEEDVAEDEASSSGNPNASNRKSHTISVSIELEHKPNNASEPVAGASTTGAAAIAAASSAAAAESSDQQLPSPQITPDMGPVFTLLNTFENSSRTPTYDPSVSPLFQFSPKCQVLRSSLASKFLLPDPALTSYPTNGAGTSPYNSIVRSTSSASLNSTTALAQTGSQGSFSMPSSTSSTPYLFPKRKYFKSKNPNGETLNFILKNSFSIVDDAETEALGEIGADSKEHDASQTLLTLRKSSIDNLLN